MCWTEACQGVRMIKFLSILDRYESSELNQMEAAELLGMGSGRSGAGARGLMRTGRPGFWTCGLGKRRGNGCQWIALRRWRLCTGRVIAALPPSIFTRIWFRITSFPWAPSGRRYSCKREVFWLRPNGAAPPRTPFGANVRGGPCRACCCIRTARGTNGLQARRHLT